MQSDHGDGRETAGADGAELRELPRVPMGALELVVECQQMLAGQRDQFTALADYVATRREYWQGSGS